MGVDDWSTNEAQNASLGSYDVSRGECPDASTSEHARELMANIKALSDSVDERFENFVGENIEVDGVSIVNNDGTLSCVDVALDGDTEDLLTDKIAEIEAAAETASGKASDAATAAEQAAASASAAVGSVSSAVDAANAAAAQASLAAQAAGRAQAGAAVAESAVQAVVAATNLNWQYSEKAASVEVYPVPMTALEPVVYFSFAETEPAEGDKAPDNPSVLSGVTSVTLAHCESEGVDESLYTVDLGGTFYGGAVNFATGEMVVTHALREISGSPYAATPHDNGVTTFEYKFSQQDQTNPVEGAACSHFNLSTEGYASGVDGWRLSKVRIYFDSTTITSSAGFSSWLSEQKTAGTPVLIAYKLNTPFSVQLSPMQISAFPQFDKYVPQVNTLYSDQQAVKVGYAKSPARTEYELAQAILAVEGGE